jgi:hypothetical protein
MATMLDDETVAIFWGDLVRFAEGPGYGRYGTVVGSTGDNFILSPRGVNAGPKDDRYEAPRAKCTLVTRRGDRR